MKIIKQVGVFTFFETKPTEDTTFVGIKVGEYTLPDLHHTIEDAYIMAAIMKLQLNDMLMKCVQRPL